MLLTINNPVPSQSGRLGTSVAAIGNNVLVGVPGDNTGADRAGAAYLVNSSTGAHIRTFLNPTPEVGEVFGTSVAAVGINVLVGAPGSNRGGSVYLFDGQTGALVRTFLNPTADGGDHFAESVAVVGNNVLVGASGDDTGADHAGAAYLFDGQTGVLLHTFLRPTPVALDNFGASVAGVGNNVLIGAPFDDAGATNAGAAYLFDGSTGELLFTIFNPTPAISDDFGNSVAAEGNNVLVGARGDDTAANDAGAAYLFDGSTGALLRTFLNPTPKSGDGFGVSVAAVGNNVLVGASGDDAGAVNAGAAYLFDGQTGALLQTFLNPTPAASDRFGGTVAAVGNNILVGASQDDAGALDAGAAYLFDGATFEALAVNGPNDLTLRPNGNNIEILDNNTGLIVYTERQGKTIIIIGADSEDDTLTIELNPPTPGFAEIDGRISFDGGETGVDRLVLVSTGNALAEVDYLPYGAIPGTGSVMEKVGGIPRTRMSFRGLEAVEINGNQGGSLLFVTPNSDDDLTVDPDLGSNDEAANTISGTSGGVPLTPLTFHSSNKVTIDTGLNDRRFADDLLTISGNLIAEELHNFTISTGKGRDQLLIGASLQLPVLGLTARFSGGLGIDRIAANADIDLRLTNAALNAAGGRLELLSVEEGFLVGDSGDTKFDASAFRGNVTLAGGDGDDTLIAGGGDDLLIGGDGDDDLRAGNGNNIVDGGDGDDRLTSGTGLDELNAGEGNNYLDSGAGNDQLFTGAGNDTLIGGTGNDLIDAGDGDDWLDGGSGNDQLFGGTGADRLIGFTGNDLLDAGDGNDTADGGTGNDSILGGAGNDSLTGGTGNDSMEGGDGDDALFGGDGSDSMIGGLGIDFLDGGLGTNHLED